MTVAPSTPPSPSRPHWQGPWDLLIAGICFWTAGLCVAMNVQCPTALAFFAWTKEAVAVAAAFALALPPVRRRFPFPLWASLALALGVAWVWGIGDVFYWDGIHTAGRAKMLTHGEWSGLPRLSLSYAILGGLFESLGDHNWVGHLYVMAAGASLIAGLALRARLHGKAALTALLAVFTPHVFILGKWLYLDLPVVAGIGWTLLAFDWAWRRERGWRWTLAFAVLAATAALKEIGFVAALALPLLIPYSERGRRWRVAVLTVMALAVAVGMTGALSWFYGTHHPTRVTAAGSHLHWLWFDPSIGSAARATSWFLASAAEHGRVLLAFAFGLFAFASLIKVRQPVGRWFLLGVLAAQGFLVVQFLEIAPAGHWQGAFLTDPATTAPVLWAGGAALVFLLAGTIRGSLAWRRLAPIEAMAWVVVVAVVFIFSAMGKTHGSGDSLQVELDWRYLAPAAALTAFLAAGGIVRLLSREHPVWFRLAVGLAVAFTLEVVALHAMAGAAYFGEKARLHGRAYEALAARPERFVATHWPFVIDQRETQSLFDYGSLRWASDGFEVHSLSVVERVHILPPAKRPKQYGLILQTEGIWPTVSAWKWFPDVVWHDEADVFYLQPLSWQLGKSEAVASTWIVRAPLE